MVDRIRGWQSEGNAPRRTSRPGGIGIVLVAGILAILADASALRGQIAARPAAIERAAGIVSMFGVAPAAASSMVGGSASRNARWFSARHRIQPLRLEASANSGIPAAVEISASVSMTEGSEAWFLLQTNQPVAPGLALAASALLPGTGQFLQSNDRWVPYLALEIWGWISFFKRRSDAHELAADYRDLAWSVARRVSIGERRDTIFEYYEEMTHYASSGTFDSDPEAGGIQPEFDVRTFNGDLWDLSRGLYWGGQTYLPGTDQYNQALDYYLDHAIPPSFTWAWGDSFLEQQSFRELIRRSDEAYRTSTQFLGLILANHIVSAVDALVIGRLRGAAGESRLRIGSGFEPATGRTPRLRIEATWRW